MAEEAQSTLLDMFFKTLNKDGEIIVGERLANNWDVIGIHLEAIFRESKGVAVIASLEAIGEILTGRKLTVSERNGLDEEQENLYSWDIEDNTYE